MRILIMTLAAVAAVSAGALGQTPAPSPAASVAPATGIRQVLIVHMKDFAYAPIDARVSVGESVMFLNDDESAHTVTAEDGSFDSGDMPKGATWSHTFTKSGTFAYLCAYHRFMRGSVVVVSAR